MNINNEIQPELLKLITVSKLLNVSTMTLRKYIKNNMLSAIKMGNKYYVPINSLKEFTYKLIAQSKGLSLEEYNKLLEKQELEKLEKFYNVLSNK